MKVPNTKDWCLIKMNTGKPMADKAVKSILDSAKSTGTMDALELNIGITGKITGDALTYGNSRIDGFRNKVIQIRFEEDSILFVTANLHEYVAKKETMLHASH